MPEHTSNGMQCNEFDALLADVLDGVLSGAQLDRFQSHARTCSTCSVLMAEAEAGRNWLKELTEVEPPIGLVENILASTTGIVSNRLLSPVRPAQPAITWLERVQAWVSGMTEPVWATVRQPRFAMSFGMAFFSLSVALSVAGVRPSDLRQLSLRPTAIRRTYYSTQARVVRYYDNIKLVYEMQAAVRGIRRNILPAESRTPKPREHKNDTTQQPDQKQERNYSQYDNHVILADSSLGPSVFDLSKLDPSNPDLPVVSVTTYRRFV
ncbi:MAG TPA: zf-HC2 domain-containing protein [Candidatus Sulfotelmatobacter sp.]|nr:zf-HC2 domain-containing protein [Candidatus Sulfotelmatobacter sp.]